MSNAETVDRWLQTTVVYGLAFVFLSLFCLIVLWIFWRLAYHGVSVVQTLREWLPQWFAAQIESHKAVVKSADTLTESLGGVREKVDKTHAGVAGMIRAAEKHAKRQNVDSDVIIELESARNALR